MATRMKPLLEGRAEVVGKKISPSCNLDISSIGVPLQCHRLQAVALGLLGPIKLHPGIQIVHTAQQHKIKTGVPQGGVLSPTLFNLYTSDIPTLPNDKIKLVTDTEIMILYSHTNVNTLKQQVHSSLHDKQLDYTKQLHLKPFKNTMLFTPHIKLNTKT